MGFPSQPSIQKTMTYNTAPQRIKKYPTHKRSRETDLSIASPNPKFHSSSKYPLFFLLYLFCNNNYRNKK